MKGLLRLLGCGVGVFGLTACIGDGIPKACMKVYDVQLEMQLESIANLYDLMPADKQAEIDNKLAQGREDFKKTIQEQIDLNGKEATIEMCERTLGQLEFFKRVM